MPSYPSNPFSSLSQAPQLQPEYRSFESHPAFPPTAGIGSKLRLFHVGFGTPALQGTLEAHTRDVLCVVYTPAKALQAMLASGGADWVVCVWRAPGDCTPTIKHRIRGHRDEVALPQAFNPPPSPCSLTLERYATLVLGPRSWQCWDLTTACHGHRFGLSPSPPAGQSSQVAPSIVPSRSGTLAPEERS